MKKRRPAYAPNERGYFEPVRRRVYSSKHVRIFPDPIADDIVANNISNVEFDYTYDRGELI